MAVAVAVTILGIVGCTDQVAPTQSSTIRSQAAVESALGKDADAGQTLDDQFSRVGARAKGFAGAYIDRDGSLVVALTDPTDSALAVAALADEIGASVRVSDKIAPDVAMAIRSLPSRVRTEKATYTFAQMLEWKRRISPQLMALDGVVSIDVDERANVIAVGTENTQARTLAAKIGAAAGVPESAVLFKTESKGIFTRQASNLGVRQRPLTGGFLIGPIGCTMTGTAYRGFEPLMVTASHCTAQTFSLDGGTTFQGNAGDPWGFETTDPSSYSCGPWGWGYQCRRADVAAYNVSGISIPPGDTLAFSVGLIARTEYPANGLNQISGSRNINQSTPYWYIQAERSTVLTGMTLHKVGNATGWTYGDVFATCVDKQSSNNVWIVCSDRANAYDELGDSGSPVFIVNNSVGVTFVGLIWGKDLNSPVINFSNLTQIKQDLGNIRFF